MVIFCHIYIFPIINKRGIESVEIDLWQLMPYFYLNIIRGESFVLVQAVLRDEVVSEGGLEVVQQPVLVHVGQQADHTGGDEDCDEQYRVPGHQLPALKGHRRVAEEGDEDGDGPGADEEPDGDLVDLAGHHQHQLPLLQEGPEPQAEHHTPA